MNQWLQTFDQTEWSGCSGLWLEPEDTDECRFDCRMRVENNALHYSWMYNDEMKKWRLTFEEAGGN